MIQKRLLLQASLIIAGILACKSSNVESVWFPEPAAIDGADEEWETVHFQSLESEQISMGLGNDAGHLYLIIRVENPMLARALSRRGVELSFTDESEKRALLSLYYTGSGRPAFGRGDSFWESLTEDQKNRFLDRRKEIQQMIRASQKGKSVLLPPDGTEGPLAASSFSGEGFLYEFSIPLEPDSDRPFTLALQPGNIFRISIKAGEAGDESPEMIPGIGPPGGMEGVIPEEGGMERMGGRRGGFEPGRGFQALEKKYSFTVILAGGPQHESG